MHCELVWRCQVNRPSIYPSIILNHYPSINIPSHLRINSSVHPSSTHSSILPSFNPSSVHLTIIFHQLIHPFILCPSKSSLCSPIHPYPSSITQGSTSVSYSRSLFDHFLCCLFVVEQFVLRTFSYTCLTGVYALSLFLSPSFPVLCVCSEGPTARSHTRTHTHTGCVLFSPSVFSSIV